MFTAIPRRLLIGLLSAVAVALLLQSFALIAAKSTITKAIEDALCGSAAPERNNLLLA